MSSGHPSPRVAGIPHAVAVNSGTSDLHLLVRAFGIHEGDEVITTPCQPAKLDVIRQIADRHGMVVIEDSCE
ncbi:MAG: DegT/DnrJ/EryC1/StrS family aminotransferase [Bacillota bacterium]